MEDHVKVSWARALEHKDAPSAVKARHVELYDAVANFSRELIATDVVARTLWPLIAAFSDALAARDAMIADLSVRVLELEEVDASDDHPAKIDGRSRAARAQRQPVGV